ncbi:MAG: hypothetical protein J6Y78_10825 [Paludibacteraceae bacterium]|nr:hypothetical protein [Paludibacteraceae bacterium]
MKKIAEFDVRELPEEMSLGMRGILLRMSLEVRLRKRFGSTDDELKTHDELVALCNDHKFIDGIIDENEEVGTIKDVFSLLYMSMFEQLYEKKGIDPSMYLADNNEVKSALNSRMPKDVWEMLGYFQIPLGEERVFGETHVNLIECN